MKFPLDFVQFDRDMKGPGPRSGAHQSSTFATNQKAYQVLIEYDAELGVVRLMTAATGPRDEVLVPLERVVQMEPAAKPAKVEKKSAA